MGIADHLARRNVLLVVDNCEHLLEPTAALVERLLDAAPALRVLATSREPLGVEGERCEPVPPLDVDGPTSTAARLFAERAVAADPWIELDDRDLVTIAEITRRLDGMPLAIELAAARVRSLTPAQIARPPGRTVPAPPERASAAPASTAHPRGHHRLVL